ncbi:transposase for insertion sequence element [Escherichia coli M056]|nr:transposase for insertion sequence element [Escherichia coli M056]
MSVSGFMGYLKGKSSLMLYEQFGDFENSNTGTGSSGAEGTTSIRWVRTRRRYRIT